MSFSTLSFMFRRNAITDGFISDLFEPLYEVTRDPSVDPKLHIFLRNVIGFDSVDDESKPEKRIWRKYPLPKQWDFETNPPYSYWSYFLYANMVSLNHWRKERGFSGFSKVDGESELNISAYFVFASSVSQTRLFSALMLEKLATRSILLLLF